MKPGPPMIYCFQPVFSRPPIRLYPGFPDPVRATMHHCGAVETEHLCVMQGEGWVVRLCGALLDAGIAPNRSLIVTRWDREPVLTVLSIGENAAERAP